MSQNINLRGCETHTRAIKGGTFFGVIALIGLAFYLAQFFATLQGN